MRKFVIGVVVGIVILIAVGVVAFFNLNALLERNRDRIESLASEAAGRKVTLDKASVAFSKGLAIRIDGVRVAEDPRFGKTDFLRLETAFVEVALWPLLQNRIEVRGVRLERPVIQLIDGKKGWNFSSLGESEAKPAAPAPEGETPPMALVIGALAISDGTIVYSDRTAKDGLALTIEEFESSGANLTLDGPIALAFSGLVRPTAGDAALASRVRGELEIRDRATGAGRLHLESPSFKPKLVGVELSEGDAKERIDGLDLTIDIPADVEKTGYPIALAAKEARLAGFDLDTIDGKLVYRGSKLAIERFATGVAGGRAELAGNLGFGAPGKAPFDLDLKVDALDSDELAHVLLGVPRGVVSGRIGGEFDLAGKSLDWETLKRTLAGQIRLQVDGGALESVNVLDAFVTRLVGDPGVGQLLAGSLREAVPSALQGERTPFDLLRLAVAIQDGRLRADDLQLAAKDFGLSASGGVGLDGLLDGDGRIRFSPELSKKILKKADRFAPLLADGDVVVLPLQLGGKLSAPYLRPDLSALGSQAREAATEELKEKAAKKLTDAIFGKKKNKSDAGGDAAATAADGAEPAAPSQKELEREAAKDLVKQGLGRLLGD
ncbi:MAG: AsmA family protein [Myxococcota bacterium]